MLKQSDDRAEVVDPRGIDGSYPTRIFVLDRRSERRNPSVPNQSFVSVTVYKLGTPFHTSQSRPKNTAVPDLVQGT